MFVEIDGMVLDTSYDGPGVHATKSMASKALCGLSVNFFNTMFNRICTKLQEIAAAPEEINDYFDIELIQHVNLDITRLTRLISGM